MARSRLTRRIWLRNALTVMIPGVIAHARASRAGAGSAGPGANVTAMSGERPRQPVKAAYLSYYGVGDPTIRARILGLLDRTELNAVVIDVKGDRGFIPYDTQVPLAREAGALGPVRVRDFDDLLARLRARGIYTVARIVVFKDDVLARYRPAWAILAPGTGSLWRDNERLAWLDPFAEEAWNYPIAVATEAAGKGFNEVQFDYLRFPADGRLSAARYRRGNTQETRLHAIVAFLKQARAALEPTATVLAIDLFGYTAFNLDDTGIGQRVEELAPLVDVLSPMAYPSAFHLGIPKYRNPVTHPYEVVFETVRLVRERSAHAAVQVRPWIQDFRDYAFDRRPFGASDVRAEIKGARDGGATGWMLWNPRNQYTVEALDPAPAPRAG
jgi:hypothetical protein